jgi:dGTPase
MFFTLTRAQLVTSLVRHVVNIYANNHESIFKGEFNSALLEYDKNSKYYQAVKILQDISAKHIYQNKEVQELELQGYSIVNGLLNIYKPLLELSSKDFEKLLQNQKIECFIAMRLIKRISSKQITAYKNDVKKLITEEKDSFDILEWYYRVRLIIDFISGMTDDFALHEYQVLMSLK